MRSLAAHVHEAKHGAQGVTLSHGAVLGKLDQLMGFDEADRHAFFALVELRLTHADAARCVEEVLAPGSIRVVKRATDREEAASCSIASLLEELTLCGCSWIFVRLHESPRQSPERTPRTDPELLRHDDLSGLRDCEDVRATLPIVDHERQPLVAWRVERARDDAPVAVEGELVTYLAKSHVHLCVDPSESEQFQQIIAKKSRQRRLPSLGVHDTFWPLQDRGRNYDHVTHALSGSYHGCRRHAH